MDLLIKLLMSLNLLNSESNNTFLFIAILLVFCFLVSLMKRMIKLMVTMLCVLAIFFGTFFIKSQIIDKNGLEFNQTYMTSSDTRIKYEDIRGVGIKNNNTVIQITDKDGNTIDITVDSSYAKAIKSGIEGMMDAKD